MSKPPYTIYSKKWLEFQLTLKQKEIERLNEELRIVKMSDKNTYETSQEILAEQQQEIERLSKEVDMWNRKYNEQFDIINELEKELNKDYDTYICKNKQYGKTFQAGANIYREHILYRLKELKDSDKE